MVGELHDLTLAPVSLAVAVVFATIGALLGIILAARARRCTGARRARLVAYATISVAGPGIWLPGLVGVLGLRVEGSVVRLDPAVLAMSLGAAAAGTALALLLLCYGRTGADRLLIAGVLLAASLGASAHLTLRSLATGGRIVTESAVTGAAAGTAVVAGLVLSLLLGAARSLRFAVFAAMPLGLVVTAVHMVATTALSVVPGPDGPIPAYDVVGLSPMRIGLPAVVLGGVLTALMWYFGVGTATGRDLRLLFGPRTDGDQIEPWMIEQVSSRVALSSTALTPGPDWTGNVWAETTVAVRSLPLVGGAVATAFSRARQAVASRTDSSSRAEVESSALAPSPAPTPEPTPAVRPVPGWDMPTAERSRLSPNPARVPVHPGTRAGTHWDRRDWDHSPAEQNEARLPSRSRAGNSNHAQRVSRSPATPTS